MKLKVLKYNKHEAKRKFILFKLAELLGVFLFIFGFETFGRFMYYNFNWMNITTENMTHYLDFWFYGFLSLLLIIALGFAIYYVGYGLFSLLKGWIKLNWRWAKESCEDEDSKEERLSEQKKLREIRRIEFFEEQRKEFGYCIGDTAVQIEDGDCGKIGNKYKVMDIDEDGDFNCKEDGNVYRKSFKFIKQKLVKPKLNKVREKEVKDRKKK